MTAVADWFRAHDVDPAAVEAWHAAWGVKHASDDGPVVMWSHAGGTTRLSVSADEFMALSIAADRDGVRR